MYQKHQKKGELIKRGLGVIIILLLFFSSVSACPLLTTDDLDFGISRYNSGELKNIDSPMNSHVVSSYILELNSLAERNKKLARRVETEIVATGLRASEIKVAKLKKEIERAENNNRYDLWDSKTDELESEEKLLRALKVIADRDIQKLQKINKIQDDLIEIIKTVSGEGEVSDIGKRVEQLYLDHESFQDIGHEIFKDDAVKKAEKTFKSNFLKESSKKQVEDFSSRKSDKIWIYGHDGKLFFLNRIEWDIVNKKHVQGIRSNLPKEGKNSIFPREFDSKIGRIVILNSLYRAAQGRFEGLVLAEDSFTFLDIPIKIEWEIKIDGRGELTHFYPKRFSILVNGKYEELDIRSTEYDKIKGRFHFKRKLESLVEEVKSRRSLEQRILNEAEQQKELDEIKRKVKEILGIDLETEDASKVLEAHRVGEGRLGEQKEDGKFEINEENPYTIDDLLKKARLLKEAGLNEDQRKKLIEFGVVGAKDIFLTESNILMVDLEDIIIKQREQFKSNPEYIQGLEKILGFIKLDFSKLKSTKDTKLMDIIFLRLKRWKVVLEERPTLFFLLPNIGRGVDLPDYGFYPYEPLEQFGSGDVNLEVTHYTTQKAYQEIKTGYQKGYMNLLADQTGWVYFVAKPLPKGLTTKRLRTILGTGFQYYTGKLNYRNPESYFTFRVKIPSERIFLKTQDYVLNDGSTKTITKFAIFGGISDDELISVPRGGRYVEQNVDPENLYLFEKEQWK